MVKQISDNEVYLLIKYIKSVLWWAAKRLSYIEDARCLKVKMDCYRMSRCGPHSSGSKYEPHVCSSEHGVADNSC